jgi:HTH-type transcriptional regulator/antitoxin HigA
MNQTKKQDLESSIELLPHPGETLQELLTTYGMSEKELAQRIDISAKTIEDIVNGKQGITPVTAKKLSTVFALDTRFWISLQEDYDREIQKIKKEECQDSAI